MLESCQNAQERWGGVDQLIDRWLQARQKLIQAYDDVDLDKHKSRLHFCQVLVDYLSAGHFEVYEQLNVEARAFNDEEGLDLADPTYSRLQEITGALLAFNDSCDKCNGKGSTVDPESLKKVGCLLHERFELEDGLIELLHTAHKEHATDTAQA